MAIEHAVQGYIGLEPIWWRDFPDVRVGIDDDLLYQGQISSITKIPFDTHLVTGTHRLWVEFTNKQDGDTQNKLDKAVKIQEINFFGITSQNFVWAGVYEPRYPRGWIDQLAQRGQLPEPQIRHNNYMGWNGIWYLPFTSPIFTWIHDVESLGWRHG